MSVHACIGNPCWICYPKYAPQNDAPAQAAEPTRLGPGHNHANPGYHADCGWCAHGFTDREIPLATEPASEMAAGGETPMRPVAVEGCDRQPPVPSPGEFEEALDALYVAHGPTPGEEDECDHFNNVHAAHARTLRAAEEGALEQVACYYAAGDQAAFEQWLDRRLKGGGR